jgi:hypothetical protein
MAKKHYTAERIIIKLREIDQSLEKRPYGFFKYILAHSTLEYRLHASEAIQTSMQSTQ